MCIEFDYTWCPRGGGSLRNKGGKGSRGRDPTGVRSRTFVPRPARATRTPEPNTRDAQSAGTEREGLRSAGEKGRRDNLGHRSIQDTPRNTTKPRLREIQPQPARSQLQLQREARARGSRCRLHTCDLNVALFVQEDAAGRERTEAPSAAACGARRPGTRAAWGTGSTRGWPAAQHIIKVKVYPVLIFSFQ